jgi:HPr kinase/phosphorylase
VRRPARLETQGSRKGAPAVRVRDLMERGASYSLRWELVAGEAGLSRKVVLPRIQPPPWDGATSPSATRKGDGLLPGGLLLIDTRTRSRLDSLPPKRRRRLLENWLKLPAAVVVTSTRRATPPELTAMARRKRVAVLATPLSGAVASQRIGRLLKDRLSRRQVLHGVLLDVHGLGVLLLGESGIGKSESAIELVTRGHRLVADDVVEIEHRAGVLVGRSPEVIRHYMELRGLGVIDIKALFGAGAIRVAMPLDLAIRLERWDSAGEVERLGLEQGTHRVMGIDLPLVRMPVGPGRNLATLIEVAARNHVLNVKGRRAARLLAQRVARSAGRGQAARSGKARGK